MPLMRGFVKMDEQGRVQAPINLRRQMGLLPGEPFVVDVVWINGTQRWPRIFLHHRGTTPFISPQETLFMRGRADCCRRQSHTAGRHHRGGRAFARMSPGDQDYGPDRRPVVHRSQPGRAANHSPPAKARHSTSFPPRGKERDTFVLEY